MPLGGLRIKSCKEKVSEKDFQLYVKLHSDGLFRYLIKNLGDSDAAKDVLQDTFLSFWKNGNKVESLKVKSWLFATAHNNMLKSIRRDKVRQSVLFDAEPTADRLENEQLIDYLTKHLGDKMRQCLMLKDWQGFSIKEIADIMQMSEENVKVNIFRARVKLKDLRTKI